MAVCVALTDTGKETDAKSLRGPPALAACKFKASNSQCVFAWFGVSDQHCYRIRKACARLKLARPTFQKFVFTAASARIQQIPTLKMHSLVCDFREIKGVGSEREAMLAICDFRKRSTRDLQRVTRTYQILSSVRSLYPSHVPAKCSSNGRGSHRHASAFDEDRRETSNPFSLMRCVLSC